MSLGIKDNEVVLRFRDKKTKDAFMGQLSDGWGEGECQFTWDYEKVKFDDAEVFIMQTFYDPSNPDNQNNDDWTEFWDGSLD